MKIHRLRCFGRSEDSGNVALVVEDARLPEAGRLAFARERQVAATVFVDTDATDAPQLDYYYPHSRSPLCLHATLAASAVFFARHPQRDRLGFVTSMRRQEIEVERDASNIFIAVQAQACPSLPIDVAQAAELLQAKASDLVSVRGPVSVGSPKLLVEVADETHLRALQPRLADIAHWSRQHGVSGIYAYCRLADGVYAGRNFNHLDPKLEDAATGVAAGALALTLERSITLLQGDALGQPCTLLTRYLGQTVQIGGRAVLCAT